jgi:hypothetical protein
MGKNSYKIVALYATAGIGFLIVLIGLLFAIEQRRTQAETGAVVSAFFSQLLLPDMNKLDAGRTITIVVMRNPADCSKCAEFRSGGERQSWFAQPLKSRGSAISDAWFAQSSKMTRLSFLLNSVFPRELSKDCHLPSGARAVFANPSDLGTKEGDFEAKFPNNFGYFVVSHIGMNVDKTEALFYVDHFCGGLCGGGGYVLMRKTNGVWQVVDHHNVWMS